MARMVSVTIKIADLPEVKAAITQAVEAERRRILTLVRASGACPACKDDIAALLAGPADETPHEAANEREADESHSGGIGVSRRGYRPYHAEGCPSRTQLSGEPPCTCGGLKRPSWKPGDETQPRDPAAAGPDERLTP